MKKPLAQLDEYKELDDVAFLRDLAERLMHIPVMYGTDGYDIDRLAEIATRLAKRGKR